MTSDSQQHGSPTEPREQASATEASTVLELQRMALQRVLSAVDLEAVQSCTSCTSGSCNFRPPPVM
jgi:hypothetical protein